MNEKFLEGLLENLDDIGGHYMDKFKVALDQSNDDAEKYYGGRKLPIEKAYNHAEIDAPKTLVGGLDAMQRHLPTLGAIVAKNYAHNNPVDAAIVTAPIAAAGGYAAYKIISSIYNKYKWKKKGCDKISLESRKMQCKAYLKKYELNDLKKAIKMCKDDKCKRSIQNRIQELMS